MVADQGFRERWNRNVVRVVAYVSAKSGRGERREFKRLQSASATVIPPPVSGCRMLYESPRRRAPGRWTALAGMHLLRITRGCEEAKAAVRAGRMCSGIWSVEWGRVSKVE